MSEPAESMPGLPDLDRFRLGEWSVRRTEGVLCSGDRSVRLEPRVMDVLVYLAGNPGRVVSKEELLEAVWGGAFVEEGALSQAIHSIRKALGDDARQPRFIQTVPKRGYRLVASVILKPDSSLAEDLTEPPAFSLSVSPATAPALPVPSRHWVWLVLAIVMLATVVVLPLLGRGRTGKARSTLAEVPSTGAVGSPAAHGPRIVVLPFEDLGPPDDPDFAVGLTQEITKDLGSLPSLQVAYRTVSTEKGQVLKQPEEIGRELGFDYVLVGAVQWAPRSGGRSRVRIRPRLLQVDGGQIWAGSFDGRVDDVFEVQAEISRRVVASLGIHLSEQNRALREPSTENLDAHNAYTRGLGLKDQPFYSEENLQKAALSFKRAVDLDPRFAAAWAELSQVHSYLAYNTDPTHDGVKQARLALEKALALDPDLPEVRLARAYYAYRCREDFDGALAQLKDAARLFPNDAEVFKALGLLLRRKGQLPEALEALRRAEWLDPRTGELVWILPETQRALRNFEEADHGFDQAISQTPDEPYFWEQKALNLLAWTGDPEQARRILDESGLAGDPVIEATAFRLDLYEDEYNQALARLSQEWVQKLPPETQARIAMMAAIARERSGDHQGALAAAEANRVDMEAKIALAPNKALFRACLAVALAQLGRGQAALAQIGQVVRLSQTDALSGPRIIEIQAMVDTILGRKHEAIDRLARLLATPYRYSITAAELRLDPIWDPLRGDPKFETLAREFVH